MIGGNETVTAESPPKPQAWVDDVITALLRLDPIARIDLRTSGVAPTLRAAVQLDHGGAVAGVLARRQIFPGLPDGPIRFTMALDRPLPDCDRGGTAGETGGAAQPGGADN